MTGVTTKGGLRTRLLAGFDDPSIGPGRWNALLERAATRTINLTWEMQQAWWETKGRGRLLLVVAEQDDEPVAVAPLFEDGGMVFNLCLLDHLDFVGDVGDPAVLDGLLDTARQAVTDFAGFKFYFIPDTSTTGLRLGAAAARLGLVCAAEETISCPAMQVAGRETEAERATRKESLVRHERTLRRLGTVRVSHSRSRAEIEPQLDDFFTQHIERRAATGHPSPFLERAEREFYRRMVEAADETGWLRFTRLDLDGRGVAFHFGFSYRGRFLFGVPSFAIDLDRCWPGEVLLRHVMLAALEEQASVFDFGLGDEFYKRRFATHSISLVNWGLYPGR